MAYLKTGRIIPAFSLVSVLIRVLVVIGVGIVLVFAIAMLTSCGKPAAPEVRQAQAEYMQRQASKTNQGMRDLWGAQKGGQAPAAKPAPIPVPLPPTTQAIVRGKR